MYYKYSRLLAALALVLAFAGPTLTLAAQTEFSTNQYLRVSSDAHNVGFVRGSIAEISNAERGTYLEAISIVAPTSGNSTSGSVTIREVTWDKDWTDRCSDERFNSKDCTFSFDDSQNRAQLKVPAQERTYVVKTGQTISIPARNVMTPSANKNKGEDGYYVLTLQNVNYAQNPMAEFRGTAQKSQGSNPAPSSSSQTTISSASSASSASATANALSFSLPARTTGMSASDYYNSVQASYQSALSRMQSLAQQYASQVDSISQESSTQNQDGTTSNTLFENRQKDLSALSSQVLSLQLMLLNGSFPGLTGTGAAVSGQASTASAGSVQAPGVCPAINQNLGLGASGDEVAELQEYLLNQGLLPVTTVTGYFGTETQSAVQKLQSQNGIVTSGTPATTGYGAVGPKTQQFFAACRSAVANTANASATESGDFGWGKNDRCADNADGLLLTDEATSAQLRTCKPSTGDFIAAVKAAGGNIDTDTAIELLYGTTGSNSDYRNWDAILASNDPVAAARSATGALYNSDLPYSDETAYENVPYRIITQSGNLAWVEFDNWKDSSGKPVQGLYVVDGNGVPLRNTSLDPIKVVTTAQNFGVLDPNDLKNLADKLDARNIDYKPGEVYPGSDAGVDLRGLAQGNLGAAAGSLNPEDCISKLPPRDRDAATQQGLCIAPAETRLNAYRDYQEKLLDSGDLKTSCQSITDPAQQSIYREWYSRNDAYAKSYFQEPGWVGNPASCSWLN